MAGGRTPAIGGGGMHSSSRSPALEQQQQPAAFRSILNMLGVTSSSSSASSRQGEQQEAQGWGSSPARPLPPLPPRAGSATHSAASHPPGSPRSAAAVTALAAAGASASAAAAEPLTAAQRDRLKRERLSLRQISQLTDVPRADETIAVGSLSGRFQLHLKAFSRRVASNLSFSNKAADEGGERRVARSASARSPGSGSSVHAAGIHAC
jgi:hypothetical protein